MQLKAVLNQDWVKRIIANAIREAQNNGWAISVAVVDDGGHPLGLERMDGCAPLASYICIDKAKVAAMGRRESKIYEEMINSGRTAFLSVSTVGGMLEGGLPIIIDGDVIGAIGVSGVRPAEDTEIARAGISVIQINTMSPTDEPIDAS